jgi:hypothetical protein
VRLRLTNGVNIAAYYMLWLSLAYIGYEYDRILEAETYVGALSEFCFPVLV